MAKKPSTAMPLNAKSTPAEREAADRAHKTELINHTLDNAVAVGHGHAVGSGPTGKMVPSDHAKQRGGYIGQGAFARTPQSTSSDGSGSSDFNDPSTGDYGTVDK